MDYEGRICNTPSEKGAFKLPVTVGCPYNKCSFCDLFKDLTFRPLPLEQIEAELIRVRVVNGKPQRIMLGDGNAFALPFERLQTIIELIHKYLPSCTRIGSDASVPAILKKSDEELLWLADQGYTMVYVGIESGLDDVLAFMHKDHDNDECRLAMEKLYWAGIDFGAHIMTGVAGEGRGLENARATAGLLNETKPVYICNFSLISRGCHTQLSEDIKAGRFHPASEVESMQEEKELITHLTIPLRYDGFHDAIEVRVRGNLPQDRDRMLKRLDTAIANQRRHEDGECFSSHKMYLDTARREECFT